MFHDEIRARVEHLELPFNREGFDKYGISKKHLTIFFTALGWMYRNYFRVRTHGIENVPKRGRAMLVGNHSGGYAVDGAMVIASMFLEMDPPRLAQGMAEKFLNVLPFMSQWLARCGQFTGLPEHAIRLLEDDRLLLVFPEGARGTAKLFPERHSLVDFGTGFMRLALEAGAPIVPCGVVGAEEQAPQLADLKPLAKLLGMPAFPITPTILPVPLPSRYHLWFGPPMRFTGSPDDDDAELERKVGEVEGAIRALLDRGLAERRSVYL